jgi:hypothetical protein
MPVGNAWSLDLTLAAARPAGQGRRSRAGGLTGLS